MAAPEMPDFDKTACLRRPSHICTLLRIKDIVEDRDRWNQDWEKVLKGLKDPRKVYDMLSKTCPRDKTDPPWMFTFGLPWLQQRSADHAKKILDTTQFNVLWLLLHEDTRKTHVLEGLEFACAQTLWCQDSRALCPEITVSRLLKQRGQALLDLLKHFLDTKQSSASSPFLLPSPWWEQVSKGSTLPFSEEDQNGYRYLTLYRNEFIAHFITGVCVSIVEDLNQGRDRTAGVYAAMREIGTVDSISMIEAMKDLYDKPLTRCGHCLCGSVELGGNVKFMACSVCISKLNVRIHYCSRECQKADWPTHKKNCGKTKPIDAESAAVQPFIKACEELSVRPDFGPYGSISPLPYEFYEDSDKFFNCRPLAFRRQAIYLNHSPNVDYVFFDRDDKPVEIIMSDEETKMAFRTMRIHVLLGHPRQMLPLFAEHLLQCASNQAGLDTSLIIEQLRQEYDMDADAVDLTLQLREEMIQRGLGHVSQLEHACKAPRLLMPYISMNPASCEYWMLFRTLLHLSY